MNSSVSPVIYPLAGKRVFVAGHRGMVGAAVARRLTEEGCEVLSIARSELDLRSQAGVEAYMAAKKPHAVVLAAARVGGIHANNSRPADFLYDNLAIQDNVISSAHRNGVEKLLFLGSSCIYPKHAPQPMREEVLLTGPLEPTNEWYAIAKIAGLKLCAAFRRQHGVDYISAMPTNLYGPGDNFDLDSSHVIPALIRKAHEAKVGGMRSMRIWGTGTVRREFLHVDDCADALVHLLKTYSGETHVNVGQGSDLTILELARAIARVVGFGGEIECDPSKPDGTPQKLLDCSRLNALGWRPRIGLDDGLASTYAWLREHLAAGDVRLAVG